MAGQPPRIENSAQTLVADANTLQYETLQSVNGNATTIKFQPTDERIVAGDVLVVLQDTEIYFHGMITGIEDGYAIASDPRGSLLPANTIQ